MSGTVIQTVRPQTSDNRLKTGNDPRLHEDKDLVDSRGNDTPGIYERIPIE